MIPQPRSPELYLVAYALARCCVLVPGRRDPLPPPWLGTSSWKDAYDQFFAVLGEGREAKTFRNTLKNARDAFDRHLPNNRIGWAGQPTAGARTVLEGWAHRSDEDLKAAALSIRAGNLTPDYDETDDPAEGERRTEGGRKLYVSWRHERDSANRRDAVRLHGCICQGCGLTLTKPTVREGQAISKSITLWRWRISA